jgi:hypothetical protein
MSRNAPETLEPMTTVVMKFTPLAMAVLLGASISLDAQVETERSSGATQGGLHTSEATRLHEGDVPGAASERQRERAEAMAERARQHQAAREGESVAQQAEPDWRGTDHQKMKLGQVPAAVHEGLRQSAAGGRLGGEVIRMRFGQQELFMGRVRMAGAEQVHLYVDAQGQLVKTQQAVDMEHVPVPVQQVARQHDPRQEVDQVMREISNGEVSYIMELEQDDGLTRWIQMDEGGRILKTHEQQEAQPAAEQTGGN